MTGDPILVEDGALDQAFAELDASLDAWLSAMKSAQTTVQQASQSSSATSVVESLANASTAVAEMEPPTDTLDASDTEGLADIPSGAEYSVPEAVGPDEECHNHDISTPRESDLLTTDVDEPAGEEAGGTDTTEPIPAEPHTAPPPEAPPTPKKPHKTRGIVPMIPVDKPADPQVPVSPEKQEENTLLESLDPELAKAVRIRKRLDPSKTIEQIIAELDTTQQSSNEPAHKKKTWWRKG